MEEIGKTLARQRDIAVPGLGCALLERMDDVDGVFVLRYIKHAMFGPSVYPNLVHASGYGRHRLPIIGHQALLNSPQLISGGAFGFDWKRSDIIERRPEPGERLLGHGRLYTYLYTAARRPTHTPQAARARGGRRRSSPTAYLPLEQHDIDAVVTKEGRVMTGELELDLAFSKRLESDAEFRRWVLERTGFADCASDARRFSANSVPLDRPSIAGSGTGIGGASCLTN